MLNQHFSITIRIASRNYFAHKLMLYWHSLSSLEASDFNCSIFPQVLPVSLRWKWLSLMTKASQGWSPELLWQATLFKFSYSKVLRAIAAPSFLGLFSHTINWNSQEITAIALSQHIYSPRFSNACKQVQLSYFSCILSKISMFSCFFHVFLLSSLLSCSIQSVSPSQIYSQLIFPIAPFKDISLAKKACVDTQKYGHLVSLQLVWSQSSLASVCLQFSASFLVSTQYFNLSFLFATWY